MKAHPDGGGVKWLGIAFIETPRGFIKHKVTKSGRVTTELKWNPEFAPMLNQNHNRAQVFMDSEVLRTSNKFAPVVTSMLVKSGILGTEAGTGEGRLDRSLRMEAISPDESEDEPRISTPTADLTGFDAAWAVNGERIKASTKAFIVRGL